MTLHPSVADNTHLRIPGTGDIVIIAEGYGNSIVSQTINHGAPTAIRLTQNIKAPMTNGGQFVQQPVVALTDQYGNICTGDSSTKVIVSSNDADSWTLTGTITATAMNGVATFAGLGATNTAQVVGAQLVFNSTGLAEVMSNPVTLPGPISSGGGSSRGSSGGALPPHHNLAKTESTLLSMA